MSGGVLGAGVMTMALTPFDPSASGYILFDGADLLLPRHRVRLSEIGQRARAASAADRAGTVIRRARDGRHVWVLWDGLKRASLCLDTHLKRISLAEATTRRPRNR